MASKPPDAFLSYTRFDDQHEGGAISEFRNRLASAVRAVTGEPFEIFQDVDGIGLGQHWPSKLDELLNESRFFIPILTPNYFRSKACRDELEKFLKAENDKGHNDLVLPIYYIRCRVLEDPVMREGDALAATLHERQREDWRERRFLSFVDPEVRRSLEALAERMDDARKRIAEAAAAEEQARRRAEEAEARRLLEQERREARDAEARHRAEEEAHRRADAEAARGHAAQALLAEAQEAEADRRAYQAAQSWAGEPARGEAREQGATIDGADERRGSAEDDERGAQRQAEENAQRPRARPRERSVRIVLPGLGESITQATLTKWFAKVGRDVQAEEPIVEVETDKAAIGINAPASGRLGEIRANEGDEVQVGAVLGSITEARGTTDQDKPGIVFCDREEEWCPEMVVIPPGEFMMGSTDAEREWAIKQGAEQRWVEFERPEHLVRIAYPLAVGRFPVTFQEYGHFARATGRRQPGDKGWGRSRRPVINVTWDDAKAFVAWLSVQTGEPYRLLSEAEWEYAGRAGTTTRFWWGDDVTPDNAGCGPEISRTTEVGSYPADPWGLYDTHGNVWEWVEDCWNDSYENAPEDGRAWTSGDCRRRVLRGGSWTNKPVGLRSACRIWREAADRRDSNGFRVARTLSEQPTASSMKETHWSKLEYHDPALSGQATFNYSNNDGRYAIGID